MANFDYYLQMYIRTKEQRYQEALQFAYRDLVTEYNNELLAQQALNRQAQQTSELQNKIKLAQMKALQKNDSPTAYQLAQLETSIAKEQSSAREKKVKLKQEAEKNIRKRYELDQQAVVIANRLLNNNKYKELGLQDLKTNILDSDLPAVVQGMSQEQKNAFAESYIPALTNLLSQNERLSITDKTQKDAREIILSTLEPSQEALDYALGNKSTAEEIKNKIEAEQNQINRQVYFNPKLIRKAAGLLDETPEEIEEKLKATTTAMDIISQPQADVERGNIRDIPLPTTDRVLERAAQYYAPFGSRKFQKELEKRNQAQQQQEQIPTLPADEPTKQPPSQEAIKGLPTYANKMMRVTAQADSLAKMTDDEFAKQASISQKYASKLIPNINAKKLDYEAAVQQIDEQDFTPSGREQAYTVLAANLLRNFRKQQEVPTLEEIAIKRQ